MPLLLCDLIRLAGVNLGKFKVHLATSSGGNPPLDAYFAGRFQEWQEYQTGRNFQCETVVSLIQMSTRRWLFAGAWQVHGVAPREDDGKSWYQYSTTEIVGLEHLTGRVTVEFKREFRASYPWGQTVANRLVVSELAQERLQWADFAGYASVLLTYEQLRHIVRQEVTSWRAALKSVAGIYLITDASCGKLYVGSAYGVEGIWGRWAAYAMSGHGHNVELARLVAESPAHANHFQFSILEICDLKDSKDDVITRESHWKSALLSRKFGYNVN